MATRGLPGLEHSRYQALMQSLEAMVLGALRAAGWTVQLTAPLEPGDFVLEREGLRYVGVQRVCREARVAVLTAFLADAVLRARTAARELEGHRPLAVVGAPRLTTAVARQVRQYAASFAPGEAFGLVDGAGRLELFGEGLDRVEPLPRPAPVRAPPAAPDIFSDLNQWLLKVLLARHLPEGLCAAPPEKVANASQLAAGAEVSVPSASRLVTALEGLGFLARGPGGLTVVRREELLERWRHAAHRPPRELAARWILPATHLRKQLLSAVAARKRKGRPVPTPFEEEAPARRELRACLALFSACDEHGLPTVHGAPMHLYLEELGPEALESFGLRLAREGEAPHVLVRRPRHPEAVFRAAVVRSGTLVADAVQCWLDVVDHPLGAQTAAGLRRLLWSHERTLKNEP